MSKKSIGFNGFTPQTVQFFRDLAENNYKEWFEEHKHIYEKELKEPFKELVLSLTPTMYNIDTEFELRPHRVVSRIYRDTRFSANKEPYKTCLWMTFQRTVDNWMNYPGFFMELNADSYIYGMGLFMPKRKIMDEFRERLEFEGKEFKDDTQKNVLGRGFEIAGEEFKRPLKNNLDEYFQPWIHRKAIYVVKTVPIGKEVFTSELTKVLREDFQALEWLYNFLKNDY